jgi:hypothetical protein
MNDIPVRPTVETIQFGAGADHDRSEGVLVQRH